MPKTEIQNLLATLTGFEMDLIKQLVKDPLSAHPSYAELMPGKKEVLLELYKKYRENLKGPDRMEFYNGLLTSQITDETDPSVAAKLANVLEALEEGIEQLEALIKYEADGGYEAEAKRKANELMMRKLKIISANQELEKEVKEEFGRGLKSESENQDELEPVQSKVSFASEVQVKQLEDEENISGATLIQFRETQPKKSILKESKPVVQSAESTSASMPLADTKTSQTKNPASQGLWAKIKNYRKAHPVKFGLMVGLTVLGVLATAAAIATGIGAAVVAAAAAGGTAATVATGATAGLVSLLFTGAGLTATSATATALTTAAAGLAIFGVTTTAVGVATLGYAAKKNAFEAAKQEVKNKLTKPTNEKAQKVEGTKHAEFQERVFKTNSNAEAERVPVMPEEEESSNTSDDEITLKTIEEPMQSQPTTVWKRAVMPQQESINNALSADASTRDNASPSSTDTVKSNQSKVIVAEPTYDLLNQIYAEPTTIKYGNYRVSIGGIKHGLAWENIVTDDKSFAEFVCSKITHDKSFGDSPWKMHLSIHPDDLPRAWNILYPMLAEMNYSFKVSRLAVMQNMREKIETIGDAYIAEDERKKALYDNQRLSKGMQITLYMPAGKEMHYQALAERIESKLNAAGIRPGEIHISDRALGSFVSVRNDVRNGKYVAHDQATEYKAPDQVDPFFKIGEKRNKIITEQYSPLYEKLNTNPEYGNQVNKLHNETIVLINTFEYLAPSVVSISDAQQAELVKQSDELFAEFIAVSNKVKINVNEITNLGLNVSLLSFYGDDFTEKLQSLEKDLDAICRRQLELAGNNEDAKQLATEAAKQLEELKSLLGDKYSNSPLYLDALTATELTALKKTLYAINKVALAVASLDANFQTYSAFTNECIANVDLNTPENRNLVAAKLPGLNNYLANPQQYRKELVDLHQQQSVALNHLKAVNNDLTQYVGFLNEASASVSNAIKYLGRSLKPLFILLEDLDDKSKIIYEDETLKIMPTSKLSSGAKGVSLETTTAFKKILDAIENAAKDDPILAAKLLDKFITTNWTRNVLKNNPDQTLNKRVLALIDQLIHLENYETFVLLKKLNVPFNPSKQPSSDAIKQINAGNFDSIEVLASFLQEAGFNIENLSYRDKKYLFAVITKGNFLKKIDNSALRNILNQKPEVIFYDEISNQLMSEDRINEINKLTTNGTRYSSYYKQLTEILGKKIVLTRDEYNDICAQQVCDRLLKQQITIITDFGVAFKTLQGDLAATEKLIKNIDTKYRIPLYEKIRKLFGQDKSFSLKDLVVFINENLPAYRQQIQNIIDLRTVSGSTDKNLLKNLLGDTLANNFEAFIKQNSDSVDALQYFLSTEIDVLLKNNLAFFIKEITNEIKQAGKFFTSELKDALLNRLQEINDFMPILESYFGAHHIQVAKLKELIDSINGLKNMPVQDSDMVELEDVESKAEMVSVRIIPSIAMSAAASPASSETAEVKAVTEAGFEAEVKTVKEVKIETPLPQEIQPLLESSSSLIQVLPNENKLVTPYNANGLSYELKSTGMTEYKRPNDYSMRFDEAKRGYSDDEKKVLLHMTINSIANLIKQGERKFTVDGSEELCKKVGRNILAICKLANIPNAEVTINGSDKPYKPGIVSRKEINDKYDILKKRGMSATSITETDIENIIEVSYKTPTPGSAA